MLDENEHSRKEDGRSLHRLLHKTEQQDATVEVDSAAFFSELPPEQSAPPPRRPQQNTPRTTVSGGNGAYQPPKRGKILLIVQAILSVLALVQLWRTQMLPVLYLVVLAALLALLWLLVKRCQEYKTAGAVSRAFSVVLCAAMALGCVWAQQGLTALGDMTTGFLSDAEAKKITKEPFVVYLSGVDTRGELTEKARSDVNILAVVNPKTRQILLINTPRDYYLPLAFNGEMDKLTHAGLYGIQESMAVLDNLYGTKTSYYGRVNFWGLIDIVDALGGIDVYSDYSFETSAGDVAGYGYRTYSYTEGWNHLDGLEALMFARERHSFSDGDNQRGRNQMKVVQAIIEKITSPSVLSNYQDLLKAMSDNCVTNISYDQITSLVQMMQKEGFSWNIQTMSAREGSGDTYQYCYSAPGDPLYVMPPDYEYVNTIKSVVDQVMNGEEIVIPSEPTE